MITVYGIKNCDTVKRALKSLSAAGIPHQFHDFRKDGLSTEMLQAWLSQLSTDELINRRGTSWRKLDAQQQTIESTEDAIALMLETPSLIKRPVFDKAGEFRLGFAKKDEDEVLSWLKK